SELERCCGLTARPTAHTPPAFRSIQITIRSATPPSSRPLSVRSAYLPAVGDRFIGPRIQSPRGAPLGPPAQPLLLPLRILPEGGARRGVRDSRATQGALARGHPRRPVRQEPLHAGGSRPPPRPAGADPRSRPGHGCRGEAAAPRRLALLLPARAPVRDRAPSRVRRRARRSRHPTLRSRST